MLQVYCLQWSDNVCIGAITVVGDIYESSGELTYEMDFIIYLMTEVTCEVRVNRGKATWEEQTIEDMFLFLITLFMADLVWSILYFCLCFRVINLRFIVGECLIFMLLVLMFLILYKC